MSENTVKQVIVIRKDLNMRKGKMVAQGAHASMGAILYSGGCVEGEEPLTHLSMDADTQQWLRGAFTKICVYVESEAELLALEAKCKEMDLPNYCLIKDSGRTEFGGVPTYTALAVGPAPLDVVDSITGHLKLL